MYVETHLTHIHADTTRSNDFVTGGDDDDRSNNTSRAVVIIHFILIVATAHGKDI